MRRLWEWMIRPNERWLLVSILFVIVAMSYNFTVTQNNLDRRLKVVETRQDSIPYLMVYFTMKQVKAINPGMVIDSVELKWHKVNPADTLPAMKTVGPYPTPHENGIIYTGYRSWPYDPAVKP